jgi:hypothetical protein
MLKFEDDFARREFLGREALKEIQLLHPGKFKYQLQFNTDKYGCYDAFYFVIDENQQLVKRVWIEIKIRDTVYDKYILETKKHSGILSEIKRMFLTTEDVTILYLNLCPNESYIYNITDISKYKIEVLKANKQTSISRTVKIDKNVIYLDPNDGVKLNYIMNEKELEYKEILRRKVNVISKEIKKIGLEGVLWN